jgi:F0F1-type ATP synthase assembly protein I
MAGLGEAWKGMGTAWSLTGTLVSGLLVWGGVGYLVDRAIGLRWLFLPVGMLVGIATGIYLVYLRYGRDEPKA